MHVVSKTKTMKKITKADKINAARELQAKRYGGIDPTKSNEYLKCALYLMEDATWHLYRSEHDALTPRDPLAWRSPTAQFWKNWEDFNGMPEKIARQQHELLFHFPAPKDMTKIELTVLIWTYRCKRAEDHRTEEQINPTQSGQRKSSIAGRTYEVVYPAPDHLLIADGVGVVDGITELKVTGKQGLVCYRIIEQAAGESRIVTEGDLKLEVEKRALEITPKADSAWRFLQFYRPKLVEAGMIIYNKGD